jgi:hypothetical protein
MTIAKTIALAEAHAKNGNVEGACRILSSAMRAAASIKSQAAYATALERIKEARK